MAPRRILFLINSLNPGGAERQLCELARNLDPARVEAHVVVFYDPPASGPGELWTRMAACPGVTLTSLHKRRGALGYAVALPRLFRLLRRLRPDVVHGYLEGNLPLLLLGRPLGLPVVWGIRRSSGDWSKLDRLSRLLIKLNARLSRFVDLVIFNAEAGLRNYRALGLRARAMAVVPNGFDTSAFRPDPALGAAQRQAWGIPPEVPLLGLVGRLDPVKDHPTFLRAAARLAESWPTARFVCVGGGGGSYRRALEAQAEALGLGSRVHWAGPCERMTAAYNALSVLVLASTDEGFPNVLGEAMACGIPCVATRVGDAAVLVEDPELLVEAGDAAGLAAATDRLLREGPGERAARSAALRERICRTFSVEALARTTEGLLLGLVGGAP